MLISATEAQRKKTPVRTPDQGLDCRTGVTSRVGRGFDSNSVSVPDGYKGGNMSSTVLRGQEVIQMPAKGTKPGAAAPESAQYRPAGPRGGIVPGSTETTAIEGKRMPPTPKPGQTWVPVDLTKHKK